jgi:hypothetical protein
LGLRRREAWACVVVWVVVGTLQAWAGVWLLPRANPFKSARGFAAEVAATAGHDRVSGYRLWIWRADYAYYLGRRIGRIESPEELALAWNGAERRCLIVEEWKRDEALAVIGGRAPAVGSTVGSKQVELYCNR